MLILKVKTFFLQTILNIYINKGHAYYGEYPLAFAAAFGHSEIYDYLIDNGADPNMQDTYGNTVLHVLVIRDQMVSLYLSDLLHNMIYNLGYV
jgi:ankyrin repeat protein